MLNEGVYRSPEWLRKYVDFELHTGEDIKGKKSKREIEKERKDAEDKKEREARIEADRREREAEREEERRSQEIKNDLNNLFERMVKDFSSNPYNDKYSTPTKNGKVCFHYTFEEGDTFEMDDNKINYGRSTYTVGLSYKAKFIKLANEMMEKGHSRKGYSKGKSSYDYSGSSSGSKAKNYSSHPKGGLYQTLKDTVRQREEQLKKMSKNDPERFTLENELNTAKRKVIEMNSKYKFEKFNNIYSFNLFTEKVETQKSHPKDTQ